MKAYIHSMFFIGGLLMLFSCAPLRLSIYESNYPLSSKVVHSSNTSLTFAVPVGWISVEENFKRSIDLWLFNEDYSMSVAINPIHIDSLTALEFKLSGRDDLFGVLDYSKAFRKAFLGSNYNELKEDEFFDINSVPFVAYQYSDEYGRPVRVVLFRYGNFYYEVVAEFEKSVQGIDAKTEILFKIQNSILSSVE